MTDVRSWLIRHRTPLALTTLALVLRLIRLDWRGLWVDEAYSALLAMGSWTELFALLRTDSGPPLYYALLKGWVSIFGASEFSLRLPSALAGAAAVAAAWTVGRRLRFGLGADLAAAAIAVSPLLITHAQDVRYYAFLPLIGVLTFGALTRALAHRHRASWAVYGGFLVVAFYTHNYGLLLPPAAMAAALVWRWGVDWRALVTVHALAYVAYLPWVPTLRAQLAAGGTQWVDRVFGPAALWQTVESLVPGGGVPDYIAIPTTPTLRALAFGVWGLTLVLTVVGLLRRGVEDPDGVLTIVEPDAVPRPSFARRAWAAMVFAAAPWVLGYAVSLLVRPIYIPARTDQFGVAVMILGVAAAISRWPRVVWVSHGVLLAVLAGWAGWGMTRLDVKSGDRRLAGLIEEAAADDMVVVAADLTATTLRYYVSERHIPVTVVPFPVDMALHPGNINRRRVLEEADASVIAFDRDLTQALAESGRRVFLVAAPDNRIGSLLHRYLATVAERDPSASATFRMGVIGIPVGVSRYRRLDEAVTH